MSGTAEQSHSAATRSVVTQVLSGEALPSVPAVAMQVIRRCGNPGIDFAELADLISADSALTARLLRVANTCEFRGRRRVGSLRAALGRLGLSHTRALVLRFAFASELQDRVPPGFDIESFWRTSLTTCQAAVKLARRVNPGCADDAFSAGLLQDIGILALRCALGDDYAEVLEEQASFPTRELHEIEQRRVDTTHMAVGSWLLAEWGLPPSIHRPALHHHSLESEMPEGLPASTVEMARILRLGDLAARVFNEPDRNISYQAFLYGIEETCGLSQQAGRDALREMRAAVENTAAAFDIDPSCMPDQEEIEAMAGQSVARLHAETDVDMSKLRTRISAHRVCGSRSGDSSIPVTDAYDDLTGVCTYEKFASHLEESLRLTRKREAPLAFIVLDVDHLEAINRDRGRKHGDEVLRSLSRYVDTNLRPSDTIGRLGGDRLAVLLPHCDTESALRPAERLRLGVSRCSHQWESLGGISGITVSVGVVVVRPETQDANAQKVLERADLCLCIAKAQGRNCTRHVVL